MRRGATGRAFQTNSVPCTNTVDIFDSGHFNPTPRILKQVAAVIKRQSFELRVNMQQQQAGDDRAICSCLCSGLMLWQGPILISLQPGNDMRSSSQVLWKEALSLFST